MGIAVDPTVKKTTKKPRGLLIRLPFLSKFPKGKSKSDVDKQGGDNTRSRHVSQITDSQAANIQTHPEMRAASRQEYTYPRLRKQDDQVTERITLSQEGNNLSRPYTSSATFRVARRPVPPSSPIWQQNTSDIGGDLLEVRSDIPAMPTRLPPSRPWSVSEDRTTPVGFPPPPIRAASTFPQPTATLPGAAPVQQPPPLPPKPTHLKRCGAKPGTEITDPQSAPKTQSSPPPPSIGNNATYPRGFDCASLQEHTLLTASTSTEPRFPAVSTRELSTRPNHLAADISLTATSTGSTQQVYAIKEEEEFKKEGIANVKPEKLSISRITEQEKELLGEKVEVIDYMETRERDQTLKRKQERADAAEVKRRVEEREKQADLERKRKERQLLQVLEIERRKEFQCWAREQERWERQVRERMVKIAEEKQKQKQIEQEKQQQEQKKREKTSRELQAKHIKWIREQQELERQELLRRMKLARQEKADRELQAQREREESERACRERKLQAQREKERQEAMERARLEKERQAEIQRVRLERERLAALEKARVERERLAALEKARVERERQEALERQKKEKERQERERQRRKALGSVGAHIEVRSLNGWRSQTGIDVSQLTPAILKQLKTVKDNFNVPGCNIIKIEYIMNDALYKQFNDTKAKFRSLPGRSTKEEILFHGTNPRNVDRYCLD